MGANFVLLWDYDGTLVDSGLKNLTVTRKIVKSILDKSPQNFPVLSSVEIYVNTITKEPNWRNFYAKSFGMNEDQIDEAGRIWTEEQSLDKTDCPLLPGIAGTLEKFSSYKQGIVSQNSRKIIAENLQSKNILRYFDIIVGYEEVGLREQKPNPKGLLTAIRKLTTNDETALYIGDQQTDIESAHNAARYLKNEDSNQKIISILVSNDDNYPQELTNPDYVISNPSEIYNIIENLK